MLQKSGLKNRRCRALSLITWKRKDWKASFSWNQLTQLLCCCAVFGAAVAEAAQQRGQGVHLSEGVVLFNGSMPGRFFFFFFLDLELNSSERHAASPSASGPPRDVGLLNIELTWTCTRQNGWQVRMGLGEKHVQIHCWHFFFQLFFLRLASFYPNNMAISTFCRVGSRSSNGFEDACVCVCVGGGGGGGGGEGRYTPTLWIVRNKLICGINWNVDIYSHTA